MESNYCSLTGPENSAQHTNLGILSMTCLAVSSSVAASIQVKVGLPKHVNSNTVSKMLRGHQFGEQRCGELPSERVLQLTCAHVWQLQRQRRPRAVRLWRLRRGACLERGQGQRHALQPQRTAAQQLKRPPTPAALPGPVAARPACSAATRQISQLLACVHGLHLSWGDQLLPNTLCDHLSIALQMSRA